MRTRHRKAEPRARAVVWAVAVVCALAMSAAPPALGQCDPQELTKLLAPDAAANDYFGGSVSVSGDTAVIGAYADDHAGVYDAGSAYVFVRSSGVWMSQAKLTASDAAGGDRFGYSVSVSGDTAVVGAYGDDTAGGTWDGSAYVFVRSNGPGAPGWTQQAKLTASDSAVNDWFGSSVSVSGDTAVIGAESDDHAGGTNAGSAYVFIRTGGVWTQQTKLTAFDPAAGDFFGRSVFVSGDTAVIGAPGDDHAGGGAAGSAYAFVRSGGVWTHQAKLTASDAADVDFFGTSVSLSGDTAVIGAYGDDDGGGYSGSAYVFVRSGGVWTQQAKLTASDASVSDWFGSSVAVSGDTAVIGAYRDDHAGGTDAGSAYVFVRSGGVWTQQAKLTAFDGAASYWFSHSAVSVAGDTAVIGEGYGSHVGGTYAGSTYVFDLNCTNVAGDLDDDGDVDEGDFSIFLGAFGHRMGEPQFNPACDFDADGSVTLVDYQNWLLAYRQYIGDPTAAPPRVAGDLDGDLDVDVGDFVLFAACLNGPDAAFPAGCDAADLEGADDGDVDLADFAVFQAAF